MKKAILNKVLLIITLIIILIMALPCTIYALPSPPWAEIYSYSDPGNGSCSSIKQYLLDIGYDARWYIGTSAYYVRRTMYQDAVFYITTHGEPGRVKCGLESGIVTHISAKKVPSDNYNYSLEAGFGSTTDKLKYTRLTYWAACHSAENSSTYGDLDNYCYYTLGVDSTVAFWGTRQPPYCTYFDKRFFYWAKQGYTVIEALDKARIDTGNKFPKIPKEDNYDYRCYGGSTKLVPAKYGTY
jgi:hypothetical protein